VRPTTSPVNGTGALAARLMTSAEADALLTTLALAAGAGDREPASELVGVGVGDPAPTGALTPHPATAPPAVARAAARMIIRQMFMLGPLFTSPDANTRPEVGAWPPAARTLHSLADHIPGHIHRDHDGSE